MRDEEREGEEAREYDLVIDGGGVYRRYEEEREDEERYEEDRDWLLL